MHITGARYAGGELHLACDPREGIRAAYGITEGDYELVRKKKKRSLDANAYAWVLIDRIAKAVRLPPIEVYRNAVEQTPGVTQSIICIAESAAEAFRKSWEAGHLGRQVKMFPAATPGFVNLIVVYGSSDYDTKQMAAFIDLLVQDAQALGIETKRQEEIDSLLNSWEAKR